jgi:cell wall assembly regulator SMI1
MNREDELSPAIIADFEGGPEAPKAAVVSLPPAAAVASPPLPPPTPVDEETRQHVASLWNRIHAHLAVNDSYVRAHLGPPATEAQIRALEEAIGYRLPADYRASLAIHDGQKEGFVGAMDGLSLNSLEETLQDWRVMEELLRAGAFDEPCESPEEGLQAGWWNRGWLPIVSDNGNSINIDLAPAADGVVGQVFFFDHEQGAGPVRANSFAAWLEQVAEELETGHTNDD